MSSFLVLVLVLSDSIRPHPPTRCSNSALFRSAVLIFLQIQLVDRLFLSSAQANALGDAGALPKCDCLLSGLRKLSNEVSKGQNRCEERRKERNTRVSTVPSEALPPFRLPLPVLLHERHPPHLAEPCDVGKPGGRPAVEIESRSSRDCERFPAPVEGQDLPQHLHVEVARRNREENQVLEILEAPNAGQDHVNDVAADGEALQHSAGFDAVAEDFGDGFVLVGEIVGNNDPE
jgi:hypothetical protein